MRPVPSCVILLLLCISGLATGAVKLEQAATLHSSAISESSGLAVSRQHQNVIWTHNDSGDRARLFAVDFDGNLIMPPSATADSYEGLSVENAVNIDWEDIATDNEGTLYIADCGNNANKRKNLAIYKLREPDPASTATTSYLQVYPFSWPDQKSFPPKQLNFDCEALFCANGKLYLLSKNRADSLTKLYRFDALKHDEPNIPVRIGTVDVGGKVTAADATADGRRIAVLTYKNVWVFELPETTDLAEDQWFNGKTYFLNTSKKSIKQCEGIAFIDPETMLISNEEGELFKLSLDQMTVLAPQTQPRAVPVL